MFSKKGLFVDCTGCTDGLSDKVAGRSQQATDLNDMQGIEDTSILEDFADAEEEYDRPEQVLVFLFRYACTAQETQCCLMFMSSWPVWSWLESQV